MGKWRGRAGPEHEISLPGGLIGSLSNDDGDGDGDGDGDENVS